MPVRPREANARGPPTPALSKGQWDASAPTQLCDPGTRTPGPEDPSRSQGPLARMTSAEEAFAGI